MFVIKGKSIGLRKFVLGPNDIKKIAGWLNDGEATRFMFYGRYPANIEQVKELFKSYIDEGKNEIFIMVDIKSGLDIGFSGIFDIDNVSKKAEPRMLIGLREFRGDNYGMEGVALLTHFAFNTLHLNKLYGGVARPNNKGAEKFYKLLGYKILGIQKNIAYRNSQYCDGLIIDMLRSEYYPKITEFYKNNFGID